MNFKRYVESSDTWVDTPHYIYKTATDTITTLPADLYADGTNATVGLVGNTTQSGTPSPSAPVDVVGVGELETSGDKAGQYKIPILNGSTTTPVYLGEVQTVRNIKKVDLSSLSWTWYGASKIMGSSSLADIKYVSVNTEMGAGLAEKYQMHVGKGMGSADAEGCIAIDTNRIAVHTENQETPSGYFYYALATPETSIVNEPLQKIGDYSDSLTTTIPTTDGANTISVDTTVQPSEVSATYHGWHPVQSAHEMHAHLDSSLFELGTITGYGNKDDLTTRIRTKTFIDLSSTKKISALSSAKAFLIAWTEEATTISANYCVGGWNGSTFGMQTGLWLSEIDVESIVETYPTYKFAVILRYDDNREVTDFNDLLSLVDFYPITW